MTGRTASPLEYRYSSSSLAATLWGFFSGDRLRIFFSLFFLVLRRMPMWVFPLLFGWVINIIARPAQHAVWELWTAIGATGLMVLINPPAHLIYVSLFSKASRNMEAKVRSALVRRLQELSISFHDDAQSGKLQAKILRDVEQVERLARTLVQSLFSGLVALAFATVVSVYKSPKVALFFLIITPMAVGIHRLFRAKISRRNREFRTTVESMSGTVSEVIDMVPIARAHGVEQEEISRVDDQLEDLRRRGYRLDLVNAAFSVTAWTVFMGSRIVCLAVTGYMAYRGRISPGDVVAFLGLYQLILRSVENVLQTYPRIAMGAESLRSIGEILECPDIELNEGKRPVQSVAGEFTFENVSFAYNEADGRAIRDLSLTVSAEESLAVVGESGSGKSTLMNLVIGFYRPTAGRILLDGVDMQEIDLRTYRQHLAVVPQSTMLFSGSIRDNIAYGMDAVTDEQIWQALETANAADFVRQLSERLDTTIGEHGVKLSGGERQRIAIARAVIRQPKVIIFDEATSSLDVVAEAQVQEAIDRMIEGRTTFVVAHRLSTIRRCDRIVVLKEGRCVEAGSHDELMARRGEFYRLKRLQL